MDENKQYIFNILGWLNILILTPVVFITIIFNAQEYVMQLRTERAVTALWLYGTQLIVLLHIFIPSVLLQMRRSEHKNIQALILLGFESTCLLMFMFVNEIVFRAPMHVYGGILLFFLQSYIGAILFLLNSILSGVLILTRKIKFTIQFSTKVLAFSFLCLTIVLYILK